MTSLLLSTVLWSIHRSNLIDVMNFACETIVTLRLRLPWDDTLFIFFEI